MPVKPRTGPHPFSKPMIFFGVSRPAYSHPKPAKENEPSSGADATLPKSSVKLAQPKG